MPVIKVKGGWKVEGTQMSPTTKEKAEEALRAIHAGKRKLKRPLSKTASSTNGVKG